MARFDRADRVVGGKAYRGNRRAVLVEVDACKRVRIRVQDQIDASLPVQADALAVMFSGSAEPQPQEQCAKSRSRHVVDAELEKRDAEEVRGGRRLEQLEPLERPRARRRGSAGLLCCGTEPGPHLGFEVQQRAHRVLGRPPVRRLPEDVVEDLERHGPGVAGEQNLREEIHQIELALPGEAAKMSRPLQDAHVQQMRIRELHEKDLLAREPRDAGGVVAQRERVKAVKYQAEVRMVRPVDDRPRLAITVDDPAPGKRLVADAQAAFRSPLGKLVKLRGRTFLVGDDVDRRVRTYEHQFRTDCLHYIELPLGPVETAPEGGVRRPFEIPERLVEFAGQSEVGGHGTSGGRRAVEMNEVILEELVPVEARRRDGFELLAQGPAHRNGGYRLAHRPSAPSTGFQDARNSITVAVWP